LGPAIATPADVAERVGWEQTEAGETLLSCCGYVCVVVAHGGSVEFYYALCEDHKKIQ